MAEALAVIGIVASCVQLADFGAKLSVKLFTFSQTAASAEESIRSISSDVSLTSTVLRELSKIITADESKVISPAAINATQQTITECLIVFEQFDETLDKCLGTGKSKVVSTTDAARGKKSMGAFDKLKWPFKQPKMDLLRSNLDRLKASLSLMLQVLSYAKDIAGQKAMESSMAYQQHLIAVLARSQKASEKRYQALQLSLEGSEAPPPPFHTLVVHPAPNSTPTREINSVNPNLTERPINEKTDSLVRQLLLCFEILDNVLDDHYLTRKKSDLSERGYNKLIQAIDLVKLEEQKRRSSRKNAEESDLNDESIAVQLILNRVYATLSLVDPTLKAPASEAIECDKMWSFYDEVPAKVPPKPTAGEEGDIEAAQRIQNAKNALRTKFKGSKLDSLQNKTDNLAVSAQGFRRGATHVRSAGFEPLSAVMRNATIIGESARKEVAWLGSEAYKGIQVLGGGIAGVGTMLRKEFERQTNADDEDIQYTDNTIGGPNELDNGEDDIDEDVVADLLSRWTLLPGTQSSTEEQDIGTVEIEEIKVSEEM